MAGGNAPANKSGAGAAGSTSATGGNGARTGAGETAISLKPSGNGGNADADSTQISEADGGNCGVQTGDLTKQPGDLLLILDRSSSMGYAMDSSKTCAANATNCKQRWATMIAGLNTVFASPAGTDVVWGLKLFASDDQCAVNAAVEVPISSTGAATISQRLPQVSPGSYTPTRAAVNAGVAYLKTLTGPESKNILLATDGEPNCNGGTNTNSDVNGTITAITASATAGFKVYVVGVGTEAGNLDNFATAGGTGKYYPAQSPQALTDALSTIAGVVASCTFTLPSVPPVPDNVVVEFDGDKSLRAPRDTSHTDGWDYTSPTTIQLYGSWCDNVTSGTYKSAKILMGCPNIPIP